jgi:hypothetical protein
MLTFRASAVCLAIAFGVAGILTSSVSANKMDGKPGGSRSLANYTTKKATPPNAMQPAKKRATPH